MTTKSPIKILVATATQVVRHPVNTSLQAVGVAKGVASLGVSVAEAAVRTVRPQQGSREVWEPDETSTPGDPGDATAPGEETPTPSESPEPPEPGSSAVDREPERVMLAPGERFAAEAEALVPQPEPGPPGEQFATEPSATTRDSAHGGTAHDEEIDAWDEDAQDAENATLSPAEGIALVAEASGIADPDPTDDEPLLDPSVAKAVASESEILRRGADA
jgi:hypothetical protein